MANRTVKVVLEANVSGLTNGFRTAQKSVKDFDKQFQDAVKNNSADIDTLNRSVGLIGGALTMAAGIAVKKSADFERSMSAVKAATHASAQEMGVLREAALDAGASTVFSANEAAGAIEELSKAGLTTAHILGGGLAGAMDLAAAGGIGVKEAAETTAATLNQFGLKGEQASHVADLLAAAAGKANGEVSDFGQAMNQAGLVANQTGLSVEETTGALAAFASAGLLGSDAGTSLKTMLQRLTPQSREAQAQFDALGISAYDAQGQFVGLEDFAGQLRDGMKDLSPEARNAAMSVMFGADAVRAASVIYNNGADGVREWTQAVDDQGYAAETARMRLDNLHGDIEALGGALDTVFIQSGSGANGALRNLVQGATEVVEVLGDMPSAVHSGIGIIGGSAGVAMLAMAGMSSLRKGVIETKAAFQALGMTAKTAGVAMGVAGLAITAATAGLSVWASKSAEAKARTDDLRSSLDAASGASTETSRKLVATAMEMERGFGNSRWGKSVNDDATQIGLDLALITDAALGNEEAFESLRETYVEYQDSVAKSGGNIKEAENQWGNVTNFVEDYRESLGEARLEQERQNEALRASEAAAEESEQSISALTETYQANAQAVQEAFDATMDYINGALGAERAAMAYESAIDAVSDSIAENGKTLDISTDAGRANRSTLLDIADAGAAVVADLQKRNAAEHEVQAAMQRSREDLIAAAREMGMSKRAAKAYADQLGLIPSNIKTDVTANVGGAEAAVNSFIARMQQKRITIQVAAGGSPAKSIAPVQRASGGSVFGPGTETSDSIPALLSNNEHVWSAQEVRGAGGHGVMDRMRAMAKAGLLPAFASGGRVGVYERKVKSARAELAAAKASKDEKRVRRAEKELDAAKSALIDLRATRSGLTVDFRRGGVDASSGFGAADYLWDASKDTNLSDKRRKSLAKSASSAEKEISKLQRSVEKASGALGEMKGVASGLANGLTGAFQLGGTNATGHRLSAGAQVSGAKSLAAKYTKLNGLVKKLAGFGMSSALLQQIVGMAESDPDAAIAQAQMWVDSGKSGVKAITSAFASVGAAAGSLGASAVSNFTTSDGQFVKSLSSQEKHLSNLEKSLDNWETKIEKILGKVYGVKGYSSGGFTGNGPTSAVAGAVHGQEFVAHAKATSAYRPYLEAMNRGTFSPVVSAGSPVIDYDRLAAAFAQQRVVVETVVNMSGRQMAEWHGEGQRQLERLSR